MQTGCWNFNVEKPCTNFLKTFRDTQRPSGQLPAIAPVGGFGWNWGNGPAWDALLFEYPWQMYCYYGNRENILESYDAFRRYLDYLDGMEYDGLLHFGMSDWANWEPREDFISSAYYIHFCRRMAQFARIAGRDEDILPYSEKAERLRRNFNDAWGHPDGGYHGNEMTSLAAPLFFDIVGQDLRDFIFFHQSADAGKRCAVRHIRYPSPQFAEQLFAFAFLFHKNGPKLYYFVIHFNYTIFSEKVNPLFKKRSNMALFDSFTLCVGLCKIRIFHLFLSPPIDKY